VVGALEPRKAPEVVARAWAAARAEGLRAGLVFAGAGRVEVDAEVVQPSDDDLPALYANALAVVQPAWLEGFAFPPIEGLAHGTPAIVADLPLYDETIGAGALRFPPGDERALAEALLRMEREDGLRERLVTAGQEAIAPLSWDRAASDLRAVFAEVVR
jgi:glycosyltransferase involved in cell wall biosynthesis